MLESLALPSLAALLAEALPASIRQSTPLMLPAPRNEQEALAELKALAGRNQLWRSYLGMGYCATHTQPVIQRNVLENPGWYTAYTPYQAEIAQGRLEALLNFQTMVNAAAAWAVVKNFSKSWIEPVVSGYCTSTPKHDASVANVR